MGEISDTKANQVKKDSGDSNSFSYDEVNNNHTGINEPHQPY